MAQGNFAQMHDDIALDVAAIQSDLLDSIQKDFFEEPEPETDWQAVMRKVEEAQNDPVKKALVNRELAQQMPDLIAQAFQAVQQQPQ